MIPRRWLVVGGAVVIAVVVLSIIKFTGDSGAAPTRRSNAEAPADPVTTDRPRRPRPDAAPVAPSDPPRETVVDGVLVRDHRKGDHPIPDVPVQVRPPDRRRLAPQLVQDISAKLQIVMKECTSAIPSDARGPKPKLEGAVFVDVQAGVLKVVEANVTLRDFTADTSAAKVCIEEKAVGQSIAAKDVEDLSRYSITLAFAVPAP